RPDQVLRASLAEVVQLGCGTPPAVFQLGYPCLGLLQHIGLGLGAVGLGALRLGLIVAPLRLLLRLNTIALGGLGLGHGGSARGELGVDHVVGVVAARL